jgi:hypothetical protein
MFNQRKNRSQTPHVNDELEALRAELAQLRTEVRLASPESPPALRDAPTADEPANNRRGFLRMAGAAAVGATAAAIGSSASPAAAATNNPVLIGNVNLATSVNDTTALYCGSATQLANQTLVIRNSSVGVLAAPANARIAITGLTHGADSSNGHRIGVYGRTVTPVGDFTGGAGVFGSADGVENPFTDGLVGVVGTAGTNGIGLAGNADSGSGAIGVWAQATQGYGVFANSVTGVSVFAAGGGRLRQTLRSLGAPTTGAFVAGEMIRDANADMYICVFPGNPGTWRKVTAQHPAYANAGGSLNLLPNPIRLVDTRGQGAPITNGVAKLAPGTALVAQITGTIAGGQSIPAGAKGILGNITATGETGSGFALVWPADQPQPATSNLNYTAGVDIANNFVATLDPTGKIKVMCAGTSTHIIIDIFGFIY